MAIIFVYVKGNVENSGFILNYELAFLGEEAQYFTNSGSLSPAYLLIITLIAQWFFFLI